MSSLSLKKFRSPSNFIRVIELLCSILAFVLVTSWDGGGVRYHDLSVGDVNILSSLNFFMAVAALSSFTSLAICLIILLDIRAFTPVLDLIMNVALITFWFICSVVLAVALTSISYTEPVKEVDVNFAGLETAISMGFFSVVFFAGSCWFCLNGCHGGITGGHLSHTQLSAELPQDILT